MKRHLIRIILAISLLAVSLGAVGCNTVQGAGEDIEAAGEGIQNAAD